MIVRMRPLLRTTAARLTLAAALVVSGGLLIATPSGAVNTLTNPTANITPNPDFLVATNNPCYTGTGPAINGSASCTDYIVQAINNARSQLGAHALTPPSDWYSDTVAQQLFVILSLERTALGYPAYLGINPNLSKVAQAAANNNNDPSPVGAPKYPLLYNSAGTPEMGGSWSAGFNVLAADYIWMYDDGWGSSGANTSNVGCTSATSSGCWAHRYELLGQASPPNYPGGGLACPNCEIGTTFYQASTTGSFVDIVEAGSSAPVMTFTWSNNVLPYLSSDTTTTTSLTGTTISSTSTTTTSSTSTTTTAPVSLMTPTPSSRRINPTTATATSRGPGARSRAVAAATPTTAALGRRAARPRAPRRASS